MGFLIAGYKPRGKRAPVENASYLTAAKGWKTLRDIGIKHYVFLSELYVLFITYNASSKRTVLVD